jgi:DNA invertase Pin-like site-specific DNA recombinase
MPIPASGMPGLAACLKALRPGDRLIVRNLDRSGRNLTYLVNTVDELNRRGIGFKVPTGHDRGHRRHEAGRQAGVRR